MACTGRRCVIKFQAVGGSAANSFYVYVTHMKSSFSGDSYVNEFYRNGEAQFFAPMRRHWLRRRIRTRAFWYLGDF